jgi:hypothetical protein
VSTAQELIASVRGIGGELELRGERIHFRLPGTPDAPRLVEQLRTHREEVIAALRERAGMAPCGSPHCAGCYDVGEGRKIHPPKASREWLEWRAKWEAGGRVQ